MKIPIKKIQQRKEQKYQEQVIFICELATAMTLRNNRTSVERTAKIMNEVNEQIIELAKFLQSNTCCYKGSSEEKYDAEYNRAKLRELAEDYNVKFDETIFDM